MTDTVQPNEVKTPDELRELFQTDEILWFNDGRWGLAGYAIPNGQGKTWTNNSQLYKLHKLIGAAMFDLMHRQDAKMTQPPHKTWWWDWQKALIMARTQVRAYRVDPGTTRGIDPEHVTSQRRTFLTYPVPFFGTRVRQEDILEQCELALKLLGEIQQHNANELADETSGPIVDVVDSYIREMFIRAATKYFGYTREEIVANEDFKIADEKFTEENYKPQDWIPSSEQSTERPPMLWWPTENDLSAIKGIAYTDALHFAERWPITYLTGEGDWESTLPGLVSRVQNGDQALSSSSSSTSSATSSSTTSGTGQVP